MTPSCTRSTRYSEYHVLRHPVRQAICNLLVLGADLGCPFPAVSDIALNDAKGEFRWVALTTLFMWLNSKNAPLF